MSPQTLSEPSVNSTATDSLEPQGQLCSAFGTNCYRISNVHQMPPFFINLVSSSDLWMFVASNGALTAGRRDAECALFPYQTVDRIYDCAGQIGPVTLLGVDTPAGEVMWQPFGPNTEHEPHLVRNLYKSIEGDRIWFEEVRADLGLSFCMSWSTADTHGFIRHCTLRRLSGNATQVRILDGLRNVLPAGVSSRLQSLSSTLVDAYKTSEVAPDSTCAVYALQSQIVDLPQPMEALRASIVWSVGLADATLAVSDRQISRFRAGKDIVAEPKTRGLRGSYFLSATRELLPEQSIEWDVVADTNLGHAEVIARCHQSRHPEAAARMQQAQAESTHLLRQLVAGADGCQTSADQTTAAHHFANVMFNVMRGGTFTNDHRIPGVDFAAHVAIHSHAAAARHADFLDALPAMLERSDLLAKVTELNDPDLTRIADSYLPLSFSRRHGDPSRPWNRFSIRLRDSRGDALLAYEGNWRDIFQNWEALCLSYPEFLDAAIAKFLNASTADGYNPYRITQAGIEWEEPDPEDPWASIGYWGDHQVVYLLKLLEWSARLHPSRLAGALRPARFSYADVPYRISGYEELRRDPRNTIAFDEAYNKVISERVAEMGSDGRLLITAEGRVHHANLTEKLLVQVLVRLTNFIPGGGIWMNTQRPEWNDANNALVGYGVSVVTLNYLRRMLAFLQNTIWPMLGEAPVPVSATVVRLVDAVMEALTLYRSHLEQPNFDDQTRRALLDELATAGATYRQALYTGGLDAPVEMEAVTLRSLVDTALAFVDHSLLANRRSDRLFHAYNLLEFADDPKQLKVSHLPVMLEGQVAALSSGLLSPAEVVELLQAMRASDLFREDLHTYILYPDRQLPGFLARNQISEAAWARCPLFEAMVAEKDYRLVQRDENGQAHFQPDLVDGEALNRVLAELCQDDTWAQSLADNADLVRSIYEGVFNHRAFTGRSGGMFGFEGLGCVYWHMVAKLLLAVQENLVAAQAEASPHVTALTEAYYDIRAGLGFNHSPAVFGAFPTDPYSHTPGHAGAQQPGMTGQVKEEVLTRLGELGVVFDAGRVSFQPTFLRSREFYDDPVKFDFVALDGSSQSIELPSNALAFTVAGVPVIYQRTSGPSSHSIQRRGQSGTDDFTGSQLSASNSLGLLSRSGEIEQVLVRIGSEFDLSV